MRTIAGAPVEARDVIRATADLVSLVEPALLRLWRDTGMTLSQRRVLRQLRDGPRTAGAVAEALDLTSPALTRQLTRLEARGLIQRQVDRADRRRVVIELTAAGQKMLTDHRVFGGTPLQAAARKLDPEERRAAVTALSRLVALAREAALEAADD